MTKKELRRFSRGDLLEMLLELSKENEQLREQAERLQTQLDDRRIGIANAGSLAEAALRLNGVFQAAQDASEQYIHNVQLYCQQMEEETRIRCAQMAAEAKSQVNGYEEEND